MNHLTQVLGRRNIRAYISAIIAYLMIAGQIAPLALSASPLAARPAQTRGAGSPPPSAATAPQPVTFDGGGINAIGPVITATKVDAFPDPDADGKAAPGATITYTVTVSNTGTGDATNVQFNDSVDTNTTLVPGSISTQPIAVNDTYNVVGNVRIQPNAAQGLLANDRDPDTGNNTGLTASGPTTGPSNGQATVNADGSFSYNPNPGFTGTDSFTYTISDGTKTDTATATLEVGLATHDKLIWFINASSPSGGDGRLTSPYNCLVGAGCFFPAAADDPGDVIFLFSGAYTGGVTLLNNEKFIGQGATDTLSNISGITPEAYSDPLPATNGTNPNGGASPTITTSAASTNSITLAQGNLLRGFTVGNTTGGAKIFGNAFGTLTVGNNFSPDVILNGTGQALNLTNGAFAASSGFNGVTTTSATSAAGISLATIAGTVVFGATNVSNSGAQGISISGSTMSATFGATTITSPTTQGILIGTTSGSITFGATTVSGGTDGVSLQNNSGANARTFGSLSVSGNSGIGFLHGAGGGNATVTGTTTITNPAGTGIDIQNSASAVTFAATTVNKSSTAGTGVNLATNSGGTTFASLAITTSNGAGLTANSGGTVTVSAAAGSSISATGVGVTVAPAISAASTTFSAAFTSLASTNSGGAGTGITLTGDGGTLTSATTNIQNPGGIGISVGTSGAGSTFNFGNTTVNGSGSTGVNLATNTGAVTFADLDISPDAAQRAFLAQNNTGTITTTSGDIAATGNVSLEITGASAAARTPLAMVLNNLDSTTSTGIGINLNFVSGNFTVNDPGVSTSVSASTGIGIQVQNSSAGTINFGNTTVANTVSTGIVLGTASNGNTGNITFAVLNISPVAGQRALLATQNTGTITSTSGAISTTSNTAVEIQGTSAASRTPLNIQLTSVNTTGSSLAPNGILLKFTSATGAPGGFKVLGNGGACDAGVTTCTGGRITATTGADGANAGNGVYLENADKVSLTRMHIDGHPNFAVRGFNGAGFTMDTCLVDGQNGNNAAFFEGSVIFDNLTGTAAGSNATSITASTIKGGFGDNVRFANTSGTLEVTITTSTIRDTNTGTNGNDNVHFDVHQTANVNAHVTNNTFAATNGDHINTITDGTASMTIVATGNTLSGGGGINALGQGITISGGDINGATDSTETMRFNISNNTMSGTLQGGAININEGVGNGNWQGQVSGNTIGVAATAGSGCAQCSDIRVENHAKGTLTAIVNGNTLHQWSVQGITLSAGDTSATGLTNGPLNVTVTSNVVDTPNPPSAGDHGIQLNGGTQIGNTNQICLDLKNNNSTGHVSAGGVDYRVRQRMLTTVFLPGYGGANNDNTAVQAYILARPNTASGSGTASAANNVAGGGGGFQNGGAQCAQPTVPTAPLTFDGGDTITGPGGISTQTATATPSGGVTSHPFVSPRPAAPKAVAPLTVVARPATTVARTAPAPSTPTTTNTARTTPRRDPVVINGAGGTVSVSIGTLAPGDSVTITFQVVIDDPYSGGPNVSNQGTVSGSNFSNVLTDDPSIAGAANPTLTPVNSINIFARDGSVAEPASGTTPLLFTVSLSNPAGAGGVSVNYATADDTGGTHPATGGAACDNNTVDYVTTSGTVNFASGERVKTVSVNVCSDNSTPDTDETLLLNLSGAVGGTILDSQAVGTITETSTPGTFLVSELRTSGPGGAGDDFVEMYNNTDTPLTVAAADASAGFGVFKMGTDCNATPVLIATIPNGTIIPARGHFLVVGSQYSLGSYATGNQTMTSDIESDHNVAVFSTADVANISIATRRDAVGFDGNTGGGVCDLLREGNTIPPVSGSTTQHSFFRKECDFVTGVGCSVSGTPKDTNDNNADFMFADTQGTFISGVPQRLGAPGPENAQSPIRRDATVNITLLDNSKSSSVSPNRVRDLTSNPGNNSTFGTLSIRRRFQNNSGANVTRLRFRIVDITTFPSPGGGVADLRAITSTNVSVSGVNDPNTCLAATGSATTPCTVTVKGTTLEQPPSQPNGGGYNSTYADGTITLGTPLANGASANVQFLLGVQTTGTFRFLIIVEALP
jgi:hypothetical protein